MQLNIIFTETNIIVSKRLYNSWHDIQHDYADYIASLGSWTQDEVADYLSSEYKNLSPSADEQISTLITSLAETVVITFQ